MRDWRCKLCGRRVQLNYDHVGECRKNSTEDDCSGTFEHPSRATCEKRGQDLTHALVEVRELTAAEEAEER